MSSQNPEQTTHDRICKNCQYLMRSIAIGQGLRCTHKNNVQGNQPMPVKSALHSCGYFEKKEKS